MTNRDVIGIIDRLMDPEGDKFAATAGEVFITIAHGYYYVRPGKDTFKFLKKMNKIVKTHLKDRPKMYLESKDGLPFEAYLWGKMAGEALFIARSAFDKDYYAAQIFHMVMDEEYDDQLLERYLHWLDDEELKSVFEGLLNFKAKSDAFISDENFDRMMDELIERSLTVIKDSPWYMKNYEEHIANIDNNWDFSFSYLCRESIIDTIYRYVDEDPLMFACMIKAFKYADIPTAVNYTNLAMWFEYVYEVDIFDPGPVNSNRINDTEADQTWEIGSRYVGKMKIDVQTM